MRNERGGFLPFIVQPIDVRDRQFGKRLFGDSLETTDVDTVHPSDRRVVSDSEASNAAVFTEEVLVLFRIEAVLDHLLLSREQPKIFRLGHCRPETRSSADRAVAPVRARRQIEISFERYRAAMATSFVGLQHELTFP